jgi:Mg-chelatase subunit ChlD
MEHGSDRPDKKAGLRLSANSYYTEDTAEPSSLFKKHRNANVLTESNGLHTIQIKAMTEASALAFGAIHKIWCMVQLDASKKPKEVIPKTHIDFIIVIDHSSSMRMNNKLAFVKATIQYLVEQLTESHRFCLIEFNHEVNTVTEGLLVMSETNKKIVLENLKKIRPEGSTNISDALFTAIDILKKRPPQEAARISSVMLFTGKSFLSVLKLRSKILDGLANAGLRGNKFLQEITSMTVPPGLTINTFGILFIFFSAMN